MNRTPEGHDSARRTERAGVEARPHLRNATRAATAAAALAALGITGASASFAAPQPDHPTPTQDESRPDGPVRTVLPGDSLWSVANANGISVDDLMEFNDLHGDALLTPGQHLRLSAPTEPSPESATADAGSVQDPGHNTAEPATDTGTDPQHDDDASATEHTVVTGDSLWDLAQQHQVSVADLVEANDLDWSAGLRPGTVLSVPGGTTDKAEAAGDTADDDPAGDPPVTNNFPGHDYDDHTIRAANDSLKQLRERPKVSDEQLQDMVRNTARDMGVDPALALAHAEQESGFNHQVVSPANAIGTMQVVPSAGEWAEHLVGRDLDLLDPQDNVTAGVAIIRANTQRAENRDEAIAAYYQGLHGVQEYGMFDDTKDYVSQVKAKTRSWA
ncbi:lytic transglycosylase domain-containing protein [Kocuria sp.]|uniref:lytic transglycosylase domain-containing protein n=1 Tax=Kocuria sp. TaxID=1871328 RepID=UPI0026DF4EF1|nr:lytic transglycosylase domain-containing protein [Kocuria sp.]MDO5618465.1 LysM peptidoglycan-binding domain-containing protein [Kocuria sp.]